MLTNNAACKYETPYKEQFLITQYWTNRTVTLQCCMIKISHNLLQIDPYIYLQHLYQIYMDQSGVDYD